uniref:Uncharacterized protein n=1 Tax=Plectus sambesii TaxID=2011161 RepID=A0A914WRQ9_9BILA
MQTTTTEELEFTDPEDGNSKLRNYETEGNEAPNVVTGNDAEGGASSGKEGESGAGSREKEGINEVKEGESKEAEKEAEETHEEEGAGSPTEAEGEDAAESIAPISNGEETAVSLELVAASVEAAAAGMSTVAASLLKDVVSKRKQIHNIEHPPGGGGLPGEEETGGHVIAAATDPGMDLEDLEGKILEEEDLSVTMEILVAVMESAAAAVSIGGALVANDVIQREKVAELALEERAHREGEQPRYFRV